MDAPRVIATYAQLLRDGESQLGSAGVATARLDAELLLAMAADTDRSGLYVRLQQPVSNDVGRRFSLLIDRRARREPLAYITGVQEFWSLPFAVTPAVLIPRPETELLVEIVCRLARAATSERGEGESFARTPRELRICDVGTGSGCVAIALARELPEATIVATDVSAEALSVAAANAASLGVDGRIAFARGDLFAALSETARFDVIVSNPPYLAPGDAVSPELAFEPRTALAADVDGLRVIRRLIGAAAQRLRCGGWLVMEIGRDQEARAQALASAADWSSVVVEPDLAGIPRALVAQRGAAPAVASQRCDRGVDG